MFLSIAFKNKKWYKTGINKGDSAMQINITARHLKLTDAIDTYVRQKVAKAGKFFDGDNVMAHVVLSVEKTDRLPKSCSAWAANRSEQKKNRKTYTPQ